MPPKTQAGSASSTAPSTQRSDPYKIGRFIDKQVCAFPVALNEIRSGKKRSCWMWYVIPTAPHVVGGIEKASGTSMMYALRDLPPNTLQGFDAARAYLCFEEQKGVNLRQNYIDMMTAIGDQLQKGKRLMALMGYADDPKLRSSCRLFEFVSRDDPELHQVNAACRRVLALLGEDLMQFSSTIAKPQENSDAADAGRKACGEAEDDTEVVSQLRKLQLEPTSRQAAPAAATADAPPSSSSLEVVPRAEAAASERDSVATT